MYSGVSMNCVLFVSVQCAHMCILYGHTGIYAHPRDNFWVLWGQFFDFQGQFLETKKREEKIGEKRGEKKKRKKKRK